MASTPTSSPPQAPHLRLVISNSGPTAGSGSLAHDSGPDELDRTPPEPIAGYRRARDVAHLPPDVRQLRRSVLRAGLARGESINPDALSVILSARLAMAGPLRYMTEEIVWDLLWFDICNWCGLRAIDIPTGVNQAMWSLLHHLHESGEMHPQSDDLEELCTPLYSSGGLDRSGTPRFPA